MRPSPVITKSAPAILSDRAVAAMMCSMPGCNSAAKKARKPKPKPPAAPLPACWRTSGSPAVASTSAKWLKAASNCATMAGVAPFCGPNTALAPWVPVSGLVTSQATRMCAAANAGRLPEVSMRASCASAPPPRGKSCPCASNRRMPKACAIPAPPSLVALPPMPKIICRAPRASAAASSWPVP